MKRFPLLTRSWLQFAGCVGLISLLILLLSSCQTTRTENTARTLALCGTSNDHAVRIYLVSISETRAVTLSQTIDLPMTNSCPTWLSDSNLGWFYGRFGEAYHREVYLLDLKQQQAKQWFGLSGDEDIADVAVVSDVPRAVIVSNQEQGGCSHSNSAEGHWGCVQSGRDLYVVDEQGNRSHLIQVEPPFCEAKLSPDGRTVTFFTQADTCYGPDLLQHGNLMLVDTGTKQVKPFDCNNCAIPTWSPDGKYLAFLKGGILPSKALGERPYILDLEQNQTIALDSNLEIWHMSGLTWSPESQHLAGVTTWDNQAVWIFDRAGKNSTVFQVDPISPAISQSAPQWSPDGQLWAWEDSGAFYFGSAKSSSIYTVAVDLTHMVDWAFDGKEIAFTRSADSKNPGQVFLVSQNGDDLLNLTDKLPLGYVYWITRPKWVK
jgi:hypothetical protein